MLTSEEIRFGCVYSDASGEVRLVTGISDRESKKPVVIWRTANSSLGDTQKSHGSCTVDSFRKWASSYVSAENVDWEAFAVVMRKRERNKSDNQAKARFRKLRSAQ